MLFSPKEQKKLGGRGSAKEHSNTVFKIGRAWIIFGEG